eukprot:jgi/Mesvir1/17832/Mv12923-RA.1
MAGALFVLVAPGSPTPCTRQILLAQWNEILRVRIGFSRPIKSHRCVVLAPWETLSSSLLRAMASCAGSVPRAPAEAHAHAVARASLATWEPAVGRIGPH